MSDVISNISQLADQWLGSNLFELCLLFLGIFVCLLVLAAFWDKKITLISGFVGLCLGLLAILFSLSDNIQGFGGDFTLLQIFLGVSIGLVGMACVFLAISLARSDNLKYGTPLVACALILLLVGGVFLVGMYAPNVMIGDEVTHYFMMKTQVQKFPVPNFFADIPNGWGGIETRRYPHSFFWHYLGAIVFLFTGGSFFFIQLYQALFLGQLLIAAYLLARMRRGVETRSALIYLLLIVSLPMTLIFSVVFYQDIPMTAQILTAFYLLRKNRWISASIFLCLALGFKVTAILFYPFFFICLFAWTFRDNSFLRTVLVLVCSVMIVGCFTYGFGKVINRYSHLPFYPVAKAEQILKHVIRNIGVVKDTVDDGRKKASLELQGQKLTGEPRVQIIANHPGDLRIKRNFIVYGGLLLYLAFGGAVLVNMYQFSGRGRELLPHESSFWLWGTGISYIILVALFLRSAPDARFFLPGIVFCLLPVAERLACLPKQRLIVILIAVLALMQSGYALSKTYKLRTISPDVLEAIDYLEKSPPHPRTVFMYPEGNYRYFPVPHEWYLNYRLREFWRSDNNKRIEILNNHRIGAVVIKKYLVSPVDEKITDLGVYPNYFVGDIKKDQRFEKVFENRSVMIFQVPGVEIEEAD